MKIRLPEPLMTEFERWTESTARLGWKVKWNPEQPRPEWNSKEVVRLGRGVFRFLDEKSPEYHLIPDEFIVEEQ